jgi:hypothetical protein
MLIFTNKLIANVPNNTATASVKTIVNTPVATITTTASVKTIVNTPVATITTNITDKLNDKDIKNDKITILKSNENSIIKNPFLDINSNNIIDTQSNNLDVHPLQRYSLNGYSLKGILNFGENKIAMIEVNSSGKIFNLVKGDKIGNQDGVIINIANNHIEVESEDSKIDIIKISRKGK